MSTHSMAESRVIPMPADEAYEMVLRTPLPEIFDKRHLAIPAIEDVRDEPAVWGTVGETRLIVLADGGTLLEELTSAVSGEAFGYVISEITGPMKFLIDQVNGLWSFDSVEGGTKVTWSWEVNPNGLVGRAAMPAFKPMWHGSARKALDSIEIKARSVA